VLWVRSHAVHNSKTRKIHVALVAKTAPKKYLRNIASFNAEKPFADLVISRDFHCSNESMMGAKFSQVNLNEYL